MFGIRVIKKVNSKFNGELILYKDWLSGYFIKAGGLTQSGGIVTKIWTQVLKKISKKSFKSVLILGLGAGSAVPAINNNWPDAAVTGVDIDPEIVSLGKDYFALKSKNTKIVISDAGKFLQTQKNEIKYDLVIVDLYQGSNYPSEFEGEKFLITVKSVLKTDGNVIINRLLNNKQKNKLNNFETKLKKVFRLVSSYKPISNIMYICGS
jgi:spermidine synthase